MLKRIPTKFSAAHFRPLAKTFLCVSFLVFQLSSCVSQDRYDNVVAENESNKRELYNLKFGAPILLSESKDFIASKNYEAARKKIDVLLKEHPESVQSAEARQLLLTLNEEEAWSSALTTNAPYMCEDYLRNYPSGKYTAEAKKRLTSLREAEEESAFANATQQKSSTVWRSFLESHPNRKDAAEIKRLIIALEVDEIMGSAETGKLPTSEKTNYDTYSSSSQITISNETGCELVVRYSGSDIKMISIPVGATETVSLSSGDYRVAASACGSNYGGVEELQGNYSSRYYIVRSRY